MALVNSIQHQKMALPVSRTLCFDCRAGAGRWNSILLEELKSIGQSMPKSAKSVSAL